MALGCLSLLELQGFLSKIPKTWTVSQGEEWGGSQEGDVGISFWPHFTMVLGKGTSTFFFFFFPQKYF